MSDQSVPRLPKAPFIIADVLLVGFAGYTWLSHRAATAADWKEMAVVGGLVAFGGWLCTVPFQRNHEAEMRQAEQKNLIDAASGLEKLDQLSRQIAGATGQWQDIQATATKTATQAGGLIERIQAEARTVIESLQRATDSEKQVQRLELDKLRRAEADSVQALVMILDHTYALYMAGVRSGQPGLARELGGFRAACLDAVRRIGLVALDAEPGQPFNPQIHQVAEGVEMAPGTPIGGVAACGYTLRGTPLRKIVVVPVAPQPPAVDGANEAEKGSIGTSTPT
ncbi:MAG TPA: hypothetical protein VMF06_17470 [Candidatus Limnocylindria bacterium]|nr:hypothetical protein [Candidatus Limnocylindria bacterium]